jgi:hypothetical protein
MAGSRDSRSPLTIAVFAVPERSHGKDVSRETSLLKICDEKVSPTLGGVKYYTGGMKYFIVDTIQNRSIGKVLRKWLATHTKR